MLVNNAGITVRAELADMSQDEILRVMNPNLMAGIYMCHLVLPYMYKQNSGSIVNITSVGGMTGFPRQATYCAAKWGMNGLTKAPAKGAGPHGIRVNAVCPGPTEGTPLMENTLRTDPGKEARLEGEIIPLGRLGTAGDVAEAVVWLCSPLSRHTTGQALSVDGGLHIK